MKQNLQKLFSKPMDRKQFLAHIGAGVLMIVGVSGLMNRLLDYGPHNHKPVDGGYGSSSYGGFEK